MDATYGHFKLLIVDDEEEISALLSTVFKKEGFSNVKTAATVKEAIEVYEVFMPDLVLLDIMLPDGNGYDLFNALKQIKPVPTLFISAKDEELDRLLGFALGAEDYITKPFSPREVVYRVKSRLKYVERLHQEGHRQEGAHQITFGDIHIDFEASSVWREGKALELTAKELRLLFYLVQHPNRILSKELICQEVWGEDFIGFDNTISVHIRKLRLKIEEDPSNPKWIQTVIGLGYKFVFKKEPS